MRRGDLEALQMRRGSEGELKEEVGEGSVGVVSPTTPTPATPGDDNPVFAIPRMEVSFGEKGNRRLFDSLYSY